ncbi:MAG: serine/threonine protein kinase, partial [Myxococcales bacterium]|nr:serine/threonine protein kinase [Myxococcales bacterium]
MRRYEGYIGQVVGGSYRLDALIKVGGMGAVYRASHTRLPRAFAVKILHLDPAANPEIAERFQREAEITSTLSHPHIVQVLDFNVTDDGVPFLVMELLQGRDLSQCLRDEPPRPLSFVLELLRQAADALHTAHDRGVIHRDLKPSNLFLCETTRGGLLVKVLDFGISKLLGAQGQMTHTHAALGTPRYMAPEQASGRAGNVDARTDIFALGTIVYEMLAGVSPFQADSIPGTLYRVVHEEPEPLELLRPDLPAELVGAVKRAMSKNADERFGSMGELAHAVLDAAQQVAGDLDTLVPPSWDGVSGPPTPSKHRLRGLHQRSYEIAQQRTAITPVQPSLPRRRRPPSSAPLLAATATETDISHDLADEAPTRVASNPFASNPVLPAALESAPPAPMPAPLPASAPPLPVQSAPMQLDPNGIHSRTTGVKSQPAPAALEAPPMMAPTVAEPLPMVADMRADLRAPQATDVIDEPPRSRLLLVFIITTLIATSVAVTVVLLLSKPKKQAGGSGTSGAAISAGSASGAGSAGSASGSGGGTVAGS